MEAIVIEMDSENAIVLFAGTNGGDINDILTDAGITADGSPGLKYISGFNHIVHPVENLLTESQFEAANHLLDDLSAKYSNISVAGYSLGGHLAADVTLNHTSISECVTFDPPGRGDTWLRTTFDPGDRVSKITNYVAGGSAVSAVGTHIGEVHYVDVDFNMAGPFPNHGIAQIADSIAGNKIADSAGEGASQFVRNLWNGI